MNPSKVLSNGEVLALWANISLISLECAIDIDVSKIKLDRYRQTICSSHVFSLTGQNDKMPRWRLIKTAIDERLPTLHVIHWDTKINHDWTKLVVKTKFHRWSLTRQFLNLRIFSSSSNRNSHVEMLGRFRSAVNTALDGLATITGQQPEAGLHGNYPPSPDLSLKPKFTYGRPSFLKLSPDEVCLRLEDWAVTDMLNSELNSCSSSFI